MASFLWSSSSSEEALHNLEAIIVEFIRQAEGETFGLKRNEAQEHWLPGNAKTSVYFKSKRAETEFQKKYDHYVNSCKFSSLDTTHKCQGFTDRLCKKFSKKNKDVALRVIENRLLICGSQKAIDREVGTIERALVSQECDPNCSFCSSSNSKYSDEEENSSGLSSCAATDYACSIRDRVLPERNVEDDNHLDMRTKTEHKVPSNFMKQKMLNGIKYSEKHHVYVYEGNLVKLSVDSIVCPVDRRVSFDSGLGAAILNAAGNDLKKYCDKRFPQFQEGIAEVVPAFKLKCNYLILVNPGYGRGRNTLTVSKVIKAVQASLAEASNKGAWSVVLPFIGTGKSGMSAKEAAQGIAEGLRLHFATNSTVKEVHLVVTNSSALQELNRVVRNAAHATQQPVHPDVGHVVNPNPGPTPITSFWFKGLFKRQDVSYIIVFVSGMILGWGLNKADDLFNAIFNSVLDKFILESGY